MANAESLVAVHTHTILLDDVISYCHAQIKDRLYILYKELKVNMFLIHRQAVF